MSQIRRRRLLQAAGTTTAATALSGLTGLYGSAAAREAKRDSLPMQLYKSMSDEQKSKVCLPANHRRRQFVSNWWYIHADYRITNTFSADQRELIQNIFDSMHNPEYREKVNRQVEIDQYNDIDNAPAVGFFGTPDDEDFEFLFTGHHVTRRCNAHSDEGLGFGGAPIFYGHFLDEFNETSDHIGNPYWYQGKIFNEFVQALPPAMQVRGLTKERPRSENAELVINKRKANWPGLSCAAISTQHKELLLETMTRMLAMFRKGDIESTIESIRKRNMVDDLYISWYEGRYDIGNDQVWDTWTIEGPEMVWYFRGQPHIHSYFHLKS